MLIHHRAVPTKLENKTTMPTHNTQDVLARQWAILRLIPREPRSISAADLHGRLKDFGFGCSRRTVERDLGKLESFGFGLTCDDSAVPNLWYWYKDAGLNLPAMTVSDALLLSMVRDYLTPILPPTVTAVLEPQFKAAEDLLESASKTNPMAVWKDKVVSIPAMQRLIPPDVAAGIMDEVANALIHSRQLSVSYRSRSAGKSSELTLNPLGLVQRGQVFYLVATAGQYTDVRLYALHRMLDVRATMAPVVAVDGFDPMTFDLHDYVAKGFADFGAGEEVVIELLTSPGLTDHLQECRLSLDQVIESIEADAASEASDAMQGTAPDTAGWSRLRATVQDTQQLHWWLRGLGDGVKIVSMTRLGTAKPSTT
jgi:predicted DNA-binding transcriptional regulator YafY